MSDPAAEIASPAQPATAETHEVVVIGAGPAGLTAAFELHKSGVASTIIEADEQVGGISRTAVTVSSPR